MKNKKNSGVYLCLSLEGLRGNGEARCGSEPALNGPLEVVFSLHQLSDGPEIER